MFLLYFTSIQHSETTLFFKACLFSPWLAGRFHNFELTQNREKTRNGLTYFLAMYIPVWIFFFFFNFWTLTILVIHHQYQKILAIRYFKIWINSYFGGALFLLLFIFFHLQNLIFTVRFPSISPHINTLPFSDSSGHVIFISSGDCA
jgi:hypothetical protein